MTFNRRSFLKGLSVSAALASGGCSSFFVGKPARVVGPGQKVRLGVRDIMVFEDDGTLEQMLTIQT